MGRKLSERRIVAAAVAVGLAAAGFGVGLAVGSDGSDGSGGSDAAGGSVVAPAPPVSLVDGPAVERVRREDPEKGTRTGSPLDDLPAGVRALTDVGQRPDWSPDGASIAFLDDSRWAMSGRSRWRPARPATSPRTSTTTASRGPTT